MTGLNGYNGRWQTSKQRPSIYVVGIRSPTLRHELTEYCLQVFLVLLQQQFVDSVSCRRGNWAPGGICYKYPDSYIWWTSYVSFWLHYLLCIVSNSLAYACILR